MIITLKKNNTPKNVSMDLMEWNAKMEVNPIFIKGCAYASVSEAIQVNTASILLCDRD